MRLLVCTMFTILVSTSSFASISDVQTRIQQAECQQFLQDSEPVPPAGETPTVRSRWTVAWDFFTLNWSELGGRGRDLQALSDHERRAEAYSHYVQELNKARTFQTETWGRTERDLLNERALDPAFIPVARELKEKAETLVAGGTTIAQLHRIQEFLRGQAEEIHRLSAQLRASKEAGLQRLAGIQREGRRTPYAEAIEGHLSHVRALITGSQSVEEVEGHLSVVEQLTQPIFTQHAQEEVLRRIRELRLDPNDPEIGGTLIRLYSARRPEKATQDLTSLPASALARAEVRHFLYAELQFLRRLSMAAERRSGEDGARLWEGLALRFDTNARVLRSIAEGKDSAGVIEKLRVLREALIRINRPSLFEVLSPEARLRRLSLADRESILADALESDEISLVVVNAAVDLVPTLAPPQVPSEPSRTPPKANFPRRVSSRAQAQSLKRQFQQRVDAWKAEWDTYKAAVAHFRDQLVPDYRRRVSELQSAHRRRALARMSFLSYLAHVRPQVFQHPEAVAQLRDTYREWQETRKAALSGQAGFWERLQARAAEGTRRLAPATSSATPSPTSSAANDWFTYYYLLNPYALFHPPYYPWTWLLYDTSSYGASSAWRAPLQTWTGMTVPERAPTLEALQPSSPSAGEVMGSGVGDSFPGAMNPEALTPAAPALIDGPELSIPAMDEMQLPPVDLPAIESLNVDIPDIQMPEVTVPDVQIPEIQMPAIETPPISIDTGSYPSGGFDSYTNP